MESYEASRAVFSRIQTIDPQNASKIIGYILINHSEKDMIRFAYGPETLLISMVNKAKTHLGLSSNTSCAPSMATLGPTGSNPITISRPNPLSLPPNNAFNPSSPSSPSLWSPHSHGLSPNGSTHSLLSCGPSQQISGCRDDFMHFNNDPLMKSFDLCEEQQTSSDCLKPCFYYDKGFCKNGSSCKFVHGVDGFVDNITPSDIGGPTCKFDVFEQDEFFGSKFAQQQRIAAQFMSGGMNLPFNNKLNFLQSETQRSGAAWMMEEEFHKLNRVRMARNEFIGMDSNPVSRQIYLTFPADSTFKEEDVSSYFNLYGPVQDVRIPYQQKRMFGFVTFLYPETVKLILAKGNPHFVCDSRVLVKPYKEKSKLPDKKQHQHLERGEFFQGSSPSGPECRDPYDFHLGGRMLYSTKEMLLRKKLEEADLQQALELEGRRLMNLRLLDLKNYQNQQNSSLGSPILSPGLAQTQCSPTLSNEFVHDVFEDKNGSPTGVSNESVGGEEVNAALSDCNSNGNCQSNEDDNKPKSEVIEPFESAVDHILPDNLFASPKKPAAEMRSSLFLSEFANDATVVLPASSAASSEFSVRASSMLSLAPHKSCFFETPRLSTGQGALEL